MNKNNSSPSNS